MIWKGFKMETQKGRSALFFKRTAAFFVGEMWSHAPKAANIFCSLSNGVLLNLPCGKELPPILIVARLWSHAPERDMDRLSTSIHQWHDGFVLRSTPLSLYPKNRS